MQYGIRASNVPLTIKQHLDGISWTLLSNIESDLLRKVYASGVIKFLFM